MIRMRVPRRGRPADVARRLAALLPSTRATRIAGGLIALGYVIFMVAQLRMGLDYDEAYNLQLAQNVAAGRGYATNGALWGTTVQPFDTLISTGPTVMLPVCLAWALTDGSIVAARAVMLAFFALVPLGAWLLGRRFGERAGLLLVATPFLLSLREPDIYNTTLVPGRVLGEYAGLGLALLGVWLLAARRPTWGALCLGLMVQCKAALLPLGALILVVWGLELWSSRRRFPGPEAARAAVAAALPTLLYYAWVLVTLGPAGFARFLDATREFLAQQSQAADGDAAPKVELLWRLLSPGGQLIVVGAFALLLGLVLLRPERLRPGVAARRDRILLLALAGGGALGGATWIVAAAQPNPRQAMPGLLLVLMLLWCALSPQLDAVHVRGRRVAVGNAAVLLAGCFVVVAVLVGVGSGGNAQLMREQRAAARVIESSGTPTIPVDGWYQNPEQQLLTGLPPETGHARATVDVFTSVQDGATRSLLSPGDARALESRCHGEILYSARSVVVCRR